MINKSHLTAAGWEVQLPSPFWARCDGGRIPTWLGDGSQDSTTEAGEYSTGLHPGPQVTTFPASLRKPQRKSLQEKGSGPRGTLPCACGQQDRAGPWAARLLMDRTQLCSSGPSSPFSLGHHPSTQAPCCREARTSPRGRAPQPTASKGNRPQAGASIPCGRPGG